MTVTVDELMSRSVITVGPECTIAEARHKMSAGRMRHLPVVDAEARLIGVLSDRDILRARGVDAQPVDTIMSTSLQSVFADTPAYEAVALMLQHQFGCVPVVDASRRVVGLLTETDLLMEAHELLAGDPRAAGS